MARKKAAKAEKAPEIQLDQFEIPELLRRNEQKYLVVNLLASRALEIKKGARPTLLLQGPHTNLELALAEAQAGNLRIKKKEEERKVVSLIE